MFFNWRAEDIFWHLFTLKEKQGRAVDESILRSGSTWIYLNLVCLKTCLNLAALTVPYKWHSFLLVCVHFFYSAFRQGCAISPFIPFNSNSSMDSAYFSSFVKEKKVIHFLWVSWIGSACLDCDWLSKNDWLEVLPHLYYMSSPFNTYLLRIREEEGNSF